MDELAGAQNRISVERGRYIEAIQNFNTAIKRFPSNIFAKMFGFSAKDYYQSQSGTTTPKIGETTLP
jgi:LemA protein